MKTISRMALAAAMITGLAGAATLVATPALAKKKEEAPAAAPKLKLSKPVVKLLGEAQNLQTAGDLAGALAKAREAEALKQNNDDAYMINAVKINIAIAQKDNKLLEESLEGALASGMTPAAEQPKFWRNIGALSLQRGDNAKAIQAFEKVVELTPGDFDVVISLGEIYARAKNYPQSVATFRKAIAAKQASGAAAPEEWYRRMLAIAYDARLANEVVPASLSLVNAYPTPTNWRDALILFRDNARLDDQGNLDVFRLMYATDSLSGEKDFFEYAETANTRGFPGEAKRILDAGIAKGALSAGKPYVKELATLVAPRVAKDRASLAGLEREARNDKVGKLVLGTADANLGYGNYAKAAELYRLALGKPGADANTVNTRLGLALAMAGDKAGAEAALKAVKGGKREELAQFYLAWLARKA